MEPNTQLIPTPAAGQTAKKDFGALQLHNHGETAALALAAQAEASVKARFVMAIQRPRDNDDVRIRLRKECERKGFAEVARYSKPVGGQAIEGWSIRFAEAAMRCMGNLMPEITAIYDDDKVRIIRVALSDLEANIYLSKDVTIQKTVERRRLKQGQKPLGSRINSYGDIVYLVEATDDDISNKENSAASKALRNHILRIVPGDLLDECYALVMSTLQSGVETDPDGERKKIADGFAKLNILPSELKRWLRHDLGTASPAEILELRKIWNAINTGETTWTEVMETRDQDGESEKKDAPQQDKQESAKSLSDLKAQAKKPEPPKDEKPRDPEQEAFEQHLKQQEAPKVKKAPAQSGMKVRGSDGQPMDLDNLGPGPDEIPFK